MLRKGVRRGEGVPAGVRQGSKLWEEEENENLLQMDLTNLDQTSGSLTPGSSWLACLKQQIWEKALRQQSVPFQAHSKT